MIRVEEDTLVVVEVGFHNHIVQRRGYRGGRARLGVYKEIGARGRGAHPCALISARASREVGFHNHIVQRRGYRGGRARLGSYGEPFPMEL
ncbi:hypothetical protein GOBAR_AA22959 [Gossypium barbadense]|uniref:Uncharacterized protein n=1 Tax=Gossypium barbadense TaxID=3634 RepID=A0A2P5X2Y6_GOSBA|nr:hypothetical protein GOBAR_AA22959 [Gossypium barbadense]